MDPDRARAEARKQKSRDHAVFLEEKRRADLQTLRELRRDRAVLAKMVRAHATDSCVAYPPSAARRREWL